MNEDCIFCKIIKGEIPSRKIYEDEYTYAFLDITPDAFGHTLVIPKKHCVNILDCQPDTLAKVMETAQLIAKHYVNDCGFDGVNILNCNGKSAHQSVFHFHLHIIPRKDGDNMRWWPNEKEKAIDFDEAVKQLKIN